jgi:hypothetical protein
MKDDYLKRCMKEESVTMARGICEPVHVPALLLSASAEFKTAYGAEGNGMPRLSRISENDRRIEGNILS